MAVRSCFGIWNLLSQTGHPFARLWSFAKSQVNQLSDEKVLQRIGIQ
tara:strand:- start:2776 stop:2916 length:141 start_codon:yes stop_codon:yes gene_type:complete